MEPADGEDPLVRVTWHIPRSTLARLREQSRLSGAPVAEVVRRALLNEAFPVRSLDAVPPGAGAKVSTEVILPPGEFPPGEDVVMAGWVASGGVTEAKESVAQRSHRWVGVAEGSPVKHCEHCHLTERTWRKHGGQPEVCDA